jgi:hypothetical protein
MGFVAKAKYRVARSHEVGKEKLKKIVEILDIPDIKPSEISEMTIDIQLTSKKSKKK